MKPELFRETLKTQRWKGRGKKTHERSHNIQKWREEHHVRMRNAFIYLRLVNTKGVALGKLRTLASDCSLPSLVGSSTLPEPEKGQNPLDLEPLPPIFSCSTLFSRVTGLPVVLQCYCTWWNVTSRIWNLIWHKEKDTRLTGLNFCFNFVCNISITVFTSSSLIWVV